MNGNYLTKPCQTDSCSLCCTQLENFGVEIGGRILLHDVNIHIHCGELTALIGPNGAGKTTLLRAILGEIPHTGTLSFLDARGSQSQYPVIGYVPQNFELDRGSPASVLDYCAACLTSIPVWLLRPRAVRDRVERNLGRVGARHLIDRRLGSLSGGELQRVLLACALDPVPNLLLLDEPVSGIDVKGKEMFYAMISELRRDYDLSIILVSHDLEPVARFADRMIYLDRTVLAYGSPAEVLASRPVIETFGRVVLNGEDSRQAPTIHHPGGEI